MRRYKIKIEYDGTPFVGWQFQKNGLSIQEISGKEKTLRGVLEPFSEKGNLGLLKRSGFVDITGVAQYLNFKGYLCIK